MSMGKRHGASSDLLLSLQLQLLSDLKLVACFVSKIEYPIQFQSRHPCRSMLKALFRFPLKAGRSAISH